MGKGMPKPNNIKVISHPRITAKDMLCYILPKIHEYTNGKKMKKNMKRLFVKFIMPTRKPKLWYRESASEMTLIHLQKLNISASTNKIIVKGRR